MHLLNTNWPTPPIDRPYLAVNQMISVISGDICYTGILLLWPHRRMECHSSWAFYWSTGLKEKIAATKYLSIIVLPVRSMSSVTVVGLIVFSAHLHIRHNCRHYFSLVPIFYYNGLLIIKNNIIILMVYN